MKLSIRAAALAFAATATLVASLAPVDAQAFRMIQNTGVGRFSSGFLVTCEDAGGFVHWNNAAISWRHNTANQGAGKTTAIQNALASWTNVPSASHTLSYGGTTTANFVTDGINTVLWANGNGCTGSCLAITALVLASGQVITETDISFNNSYTWNTNGSSYDTEAVMAHELGHSLGLHHTEVKKPNGRPTMYASYFGTAGRTLENDDRAGLQCAQNRYPPTAATIANRGGAITSSQPAEGAVAVASRPREGGALIRFSMPQAGNVRLQVFDVSGRLLTTLAEGYRPAGEIEVAWDGSSRTGKAPSGVYFARLETSQGAARTTVILAE